MSRAMEGTEGTKPNAPVEEVIELARLIALSERQIEQFDAVIDRLDAIAGRLATLEDTLAQFLSEWEQSNTPSGGPAVAGAVTWGAPQPKP